MHRGASSGKSLVLWDPGGPGLGLPDPDASLTELVPRAIRDHNVLLVVEPWVRNPPTQECLESAFEGAPEDSCQLAELATSTEDILATLDLAEARTGLHVDGAYLQSFGAARSLPAIVQPLRPGMEWAVLESPSPPAGADAHALMSARRTMVLDILSRPCEADPCRARVRDGVALAVRKGVRDDTTGREFALGLIALTTLPRDNEEILTELAWQLDSGVVSDRIASQLRSLGRLYAGKRPGGVVSPSVIGLWADSCPRLTGWKDLAEATDPLLQAFAWTFRACTSYDVRPAAPLEDVRGTGLPTLMLTGEQDAVVPPEAQAAWLTRGLPIDQLHGRGHFWESDRMVSAVRAWVAKQETP